MKKIMRNIMALVLSAIFFSCTETTEGERKVGTTFPDYETFCNNRDSWKEPDSYSFTYTYRYGDSAVITDINVTVTNGSAVITCKEETTWESYKEMFGDIEFKSITDIYKYFDEWWQKTSQKENTSEQVVFSGVYTETSSYGKYPLKLTESRLHVKETDIVGYGGVYIIVTDFKITE